MTQDHAPEPRDPLDDALSLERRRERRRRNRRLKQTLIIGAVAVVLSVAVALVSALGRRFLRGR